MGGVPAAFFKYAVLVTPFHELHSFSGNPPKPISLRIDVHEPSSLVPQTHSQPPYYSLHSSRPAPPEKDLPPEHTPDVRPVKQGFCRFPFGPRHSSPCSVVFVARRYAGKHFFPDSRSRFYHSGLDSRPPFPPTTIHRCSPLSFCELF